MRRWTVTYSSAFLDEVARTFPHERSHRYDGVTFGEFMAGPVRAARLEFALQWDALLADAGPSVRTAFVVSPSLGSVVFFAVLVGPATVEIAGFDHDPGYWDMVDGDPED